MLDRIRRWLRLPRDQVFIAEMRNARCDAIEQSRASIRARHDLERIVRDGEIDYDELNQYVFGRPGWPREERCGHELG